MGESSTASGGHVSGRRAFASVGFYHGAGSSVSCTTYPDSAPILSVDVAPSVVATLALPYGAEVTDADVRFARDLVTAAQTYLAECERLRAVQYLTEREHPNASAGKPASSPAGAA